MAIKLTKNELKAQKESLKMYRRYLPTLQLKKQQLQTEIRTIELRARDVRAQRDRLNAGRRLDRRIRSSASFALTLFRFASADVGRKHRGVSIPVFSGADFERLQYDLYRTPCGSTPPPTGSKKC